jgi:hypothetical protein
MKKLADEYNKIVDSFVWVELPNPNNFLKVKETLTRIGVASTAKHELYQSAHILHKQGRYAIVHFKELLALDGKATNFSESDIARRNTIANILAGWGLITICNPEMTKTPTCSPKEIKIIPYKEKSNWTLIPKYAIGKHSVKSGVSKKETA